MRIAKRLESLPTTPTLRKILFLVGIGWLFDAMDQGMVSGVIASIGADQALSWTLNAAQLGMLGSSGMLGMILGAALSGFAADRWGRRTVITFTLVLFAIGSLASGFAVSYLMLLICRFVTGFGLGGELPAASTLVSEFSPVRSRGRNVIILESFWAWGWIAASLVAYLAIPVLGWRAAFFIGAVPAFFAAVLRFAIPESPRYLELRGRTAEAEALVSRMEAEAGVRSEAEAGVRSEGAVGFGAENAAGVSGEAAAGLGGNLDLACDGEDNSALVPTAPRAPVWREDNSASVPVRPLGILASLVTLFSRQHLRATLVLWVLWFAVNLGYYGFVLWTPSLLMAQGFDMVKSFGFTFLMCLAQLPGYLVAALLVERIGRKKVLTIFLLLTAASAWFFGQSHTETLILISGCCLYFSALGTWGCVYSYSPELYPTQIRGAGNGWAAAFGRVGAFIAPMIVPALYASFGQQHGFVFVFSLLMAVFVIAALVVGIFGRETRGIPLQEGD
ncbi:MAG: MFS transporter [Coriobacteriales bacterium]|jgi:putative MFS transporter|nr:MFS transporter [Coriobacteriales bacterium]